MGLLFDQNLSHRLPVLAESAFPGSAHVRDFGLERAQDREVWEFAGSRGFAIVTKDSDFAGLAFLFGAPPKVIWLTLGNSTTARIAEEIELRVAELRAFLESESEAILVLP